MTNAVDDAIPISRDHETGAPNTSERFTTEPEIITERVSTIQKAIDRMEAITEAAPPW